MLPNNFIKKDPKFHDEMVVKCRKGLWFRDKYGNVAKIENGEQFAYMQNMEERVIPLVLTTMQFEDGKIVSYTVSNYDPKVLIFTKEEGTLKIAYNKKFKGGYGFAYYSDDAEPEDKDDRIRFAIKERVEKEYFETHPETELIKTDL